MNSEMLSHSNETMVKKKPIQQSGEVFKQPEKKRGGGRKKESLPACCLNCPLAEKKVVTSTFKVGQACNTCSEKQCGVLKKIQDEKNLMGFSKTELAYKQGIIKL